MKKIAMTPILLLALTAMARPDATPQNNVRLETIVRNDTVTRVDTVITTKKIKRTEVIQRMEEVYYADSVSVNGGVSGAKTVTLSSQPSYNITPAPIIMTADPVASSATRGDLVAQDAQSGDGQEVRLTAVPANAPVVEAVELSDVSVETLPAREGGDYMWIPDSLRSDVVLLLNGDAKIGQAFSRPDTSMSSSAGAGEDFDPNERVTFRGDTINMVLRDRNLGRYDRGLFNYLFIPKGIWSIGVTASYGEFSTKDLEVLDLISDIDFSGHIFSIRPYFSYFIGNNRSVGMRLGYTSGKANIGSFKVDIDEDMNFNLHDISYRSESYTAAITYNQYFGIARRGRFGIFNEVELAFSSGNSDFIRPYAGELKTTHTNTMQAALNFSPGLSVYIMDPVTFNVSFGVFGIHIRNEKQTVDGEDMGSRFTSGANFRFNIFNISF
ncbi:MAG: hypothetical protein K2J63_08280, partial [Muribaculaceae bacterium]|nr:hypothetical protein [Muribaculaceae bacterium]